MNGIHANAELLPNGMEAVFVHQPHWQTNSARLIVNAGTLHEDEDAPTGVAHFFEHLAFQGTDEFPDNEALEEYSEEHFTIKNAATANNRTIYMADSQEGLDPALKIVTQLALAPTLSDKTIERERGAIIDEARGYQYDPSRQASRKQAVALGGKKYAALGTGTVEEVAAITHEDICKFYERHYRAANMLLVICGSEPVEVQREKATALLGAMTVANDVAESTRWDLPWLSGDQAISAVQSELPKESQTHLTVNYRVPDQPDLKENMILNIVGGVLGSNAQRRLRQDLVLAYSAYGNKFYIVNNNFGATEQYGATFTATSTNGPDANRCLDELLHTVPEAAANDIRSIKRVATAVAHVLRSELELTPSDVASRLPDNLLFTHERVIDPQKLLAVADSITVGEVQEKVREVTAEPALIQITSPDETIVEQFK